MITNLWLDLCIKLYQHPSSALDLTFPEDGLDLGLALQHVHEDARGRPGGGLAAVLAAVLEADVLHDEAAEVAAAAVPRQLLHLARLPAVELEDLNTRLG